jgi:hypothetical protein
MNLFANTSRAVLLLFLPVLLWGQTSELRRMTLDEVVQMGIANSKQLKISSAKAMAAHAKTSQLHDAFIPALTYTGSYTRLSSNVPEFGFTLPTGEYKVLNPLIVNQFANRLGFSEAVFTGFRALNALKGNEFLESAARLDVERDQKEVHLNLLAAGINLYKLQEALQSINANLNSARSRVGDLQKLRDQGLALDNDVLKAELIVSQLETAKIETENGLHANGFSMSLLLGLPENTEVQLDSTGMSAAVSPESLASFMQNTPNRADLRAASLRTQAATKQVSFYKGTKLPQINVGANVYYNNPNSRFFPPQATFKSTWDAGLTLNWNISSLYTSKHTVEEAKATLLQSNLQESQLSDAARTEIANQFYNWQTARSKKALAVKSLQQALENQKVIRARLNQQIATPTELLDADTLQIQAEINRISADADAQLAYFKLLKSAGKL